MKKILVIGLWHQGVVASACMADLGYEVLGIDKNFDRISNLNKGKAPLFEPGLDKLIKKGIKNNRLNFKTDFKSSITKYKNIFIMFDTTVDENDNSNLDELIDMVDEIAPNLSNKSFLHITSQIPVGTCDLIKEKIKSVNPDLKFEISYSPENLRLGKAIELFKNPALPLIGADNIKTFNYISNLMSPLNAEWTHSNIRTAEMTKHALNSYLALSVAFGNELGNICDEVGADGHQIAKVLRREPRVGNEAMLRPGLGFSGATLARDIQTLRKLSQENNLNPILLDGIWNSNINQNKLVVRKIKKVHKSIKNIPISILGLTYKPETSTLRRSASLEIIDDLTKERAKISCHDPKADRDELESYSNFSFFEDIYDALKGSKVLILITPWEEYKNIDFKRVKKLMKPRPLIIDTNNIWEGGKLKKLGFKYLDIGKGSKV